MDLEETGKGPENTNSSWSPVFLGVRFGMG